MVKSKIARTQFLYLITLIDLLNLFSHQ